MGARSDIPGAQVPHDLFGPQCLCSGCMRRGRCQDYNLHNRDSLLAWTNGYSVGCGDYQPETYRGLEGVRP